MSIASLGARLHSAQPSDIEFLSSCLDDLSVALVGKDAYNPNWRGLYTAKCVLIEILDHWNAQKEPNTSQQREPDSDTEDETWRKDWELQELLGWMLSEACAAPLPEASHHIIERLKQSPLSDLHSDNVTAPQDTAVEATFSKGPKERHQPNSISLIPTEIFCKIFESACSPRFLSLFSPMILSHVNSHFRSIALGMPSLWSTIDDILPPPIVKLYLERSEGAFLDIRIESSSDVTIALEDSILHQLFRHLQPHAHRVKALKFIIKSHRAIADMDRLMVDKIYFGGLEKLEFGRYSGYSVSDPDSKFGWHNPSSLRELHLSRCPLDLWFDTFTTSLRRLQLTEVMISLEGLVTALECSPNVSVLVIDGCYFLGNAGKVVGARSLEELQFIERTTMQVVRFADCIHTPALRALSVVAPWGKANGNYLADLVKNRNELVSIEICDYDLTAYDWLAIFNHLPSLTHLRIRASNSSDEDLQALTATQTLPNLVSITLDNELRLTTLLVERMAQAHPKLESIVLRGWDPSNVSTESLAVISELAKNLFVETIMKSPEKDCDDETESRDSSDDCSIDGSWLSGDEQILGCGGR
ncbi:hypothetical protein FS837_007423 [Tulasnella sp. UAMH 9824]|nr:hypothetical protein FS837_007423 [Tulasnella sp. UAMH 9824]